MQFRIPLLGVLGVLCGKNVFSVAAVGRAMFPRPKCPPGNRPTMAGLPSATREIVIASYPTVQNPWPVKIVR